MMKLRIGKATRMWVIVRAGVPVGGYPSPLLYFEKSEAQVRTSDGETVECVLATVERVPNEGGAGGARR
jgi:hypothetical protein